MQLFLIPTRWNEFLNDVPSSFKKDQEKIQEIPLIFRFKATPTPPPSQQQIFQSRRIFAYIFM